MSWEPDTSESNAKKTRDEIEKLRQDQFFNTSAISSSSMRNSMGTSTGTGGFSFAILGDIIKEVTNDVVSGLGELREISDSYFSVVPDVSETGNIAVVNKIANGTGTTVDTANLPQDGQLLTLRPQAGKSLTLKNNATTGNSYAGNLLLGSDITLTETESITLRYQNEVKYADTNASGDKYVGGWIVHSTGNGTGSVGGANKTLSNLTSPTSVNQSLIPDGDEVEDLGTTSNVWRRLYAKDIYSTGTIRTEASDNELEFYAGGAKSFAVSRASSAPFTGVAEVWGAGASYKTMSNSGGVANAEIGDLAFDGYDSAVNRHTYASIIGVSENVSSGTEDGLLKFNVVRASTTQQMFEVNTMGIRLPTASLANPSANGSIFLSGSDVKIRSGGNNVNISNISTGFPNPVTTTLDMNAHTITGVLNPSNPTDVVTLDYFNSTGDGQWLELDGTGTMTGSINAGNNSLINVNDILTTRSDGTSRLINSGGTSTSNFVGLTLATGTDYYLRKSATDGAGYVFEWDNSVPSFKLSVPTIIDSTLQVNGNTTLGNANTDTITFTAKSATELNMDANKITGVQNPTNPTDVVTLDYFNSTGDTQWLELDGTGTMTGNINVGDNNINNVNAVNVVRSDSTARMAIQAGTGATTQVLFDAVTDVDVRFTEALADRFEIQNSTNTIRSHVDLNMEGNDIQNIDDISFSETGVDIYSNTSGMVITVPTGDLVSVQIPSGTSTFYISENLIASEIPLNMNDNYIQFDEITPTLVGTVPTDERRIFSDSTNNSELSVKKSDGSVVSLEGSGGGSGGADQDLNNLTTTSINQNLNPDSDNTKDLGASGVQWRNIYIDGTAYLDSIAFGSQSMYLPSNNGTNGQVLTTNGTSSLSWETPSSGSSGATVALDNLVNPVLNDDINANGNYITNLQRIAFDGQSTTYAGIAGAIWYSGSGTSAKIKVRDGSSTWELSSGGSSWNGNATGDLDMNGNDIDDAGTVQIDTLSSNAGAIYMNKQLGMSTSVRINFNVGSTTTGQGSQVGKPSSTCEGYFNIKVGNANKRVAYYS